MATNDRAGGRRQVILDAATMVFSEKGFVGANLDEVVAAASVSKQTLYKHFTDKVGLFREIVLEIGNEVDGKFLDLPEPDAIEDVEEWIHTLALRFSRAVMDPKVQRIRRLVIAEAARFPDLASAYWEHGFRRVFGTVAEHFRSSPKPGGCRRRTPWSRLTTSPGCCCGSRAIGRCSVAVSMSSRTMNSRVTPEPEPPPSCAPTPQATQPSSAGGHRPSGGRGLTH